MLLSLLLIFASSCNAFLPPTNFIRRSSELSVAAEVVSVGLDTKAAGIGEQACQDAAAKMVRVKCPVPESVCDNGSVGVSFIHWKPETPKKNTLPLLLIHGFDSSCLEYRRLGPKLAALGIDTYAVDLLGWGYSQLNDVNSFSAQAKVDALAGFWSVVGEGRDVCVAGASLGGAAAIEFSASNPIVKGCVFIDAQGFVDGVGPMAKLPKSIAQIGVQVLKSVPLRNSANNMSYYDKKSFATEDALKVGRLHCLREGWDNALVSFMLDGGFYPSTKVENIEAPSLILWGRQDTILEIEFASKFLETLPNASLKWIENCGHVPHLEQPSATAEAISAFLSSEELTTNLSSDVESSNGPIIAGSLAGAALVGTTAAAVLGSV